MRSLSSGWALLPLLLLSLPTAAFTSSPERLEKARNLLVDMAGATNADKLQALKNEALPIPAELATVRGSVGHTPLTDSRQGGEDFSQATQIAGLPFADSGTTAGALNDYSPGCGFSSAPDVVYSYTPELDITVDADLCGSVYDTILSVFVNDNSTLLGCNDDACDDQSRLEFLDLQAGNTYYFLVDGYGSANGQYTLTVVENLLPSPCEVFDSQLTVVDGLPFSYTGDNVGSPDIWGSTGTERGFLLELEDLTALHIRTCVPGNALDSRVYILDGHPCAGETLELLLDTGSPSCGFGDAVDFTTVLPAGTYTLLAGGDFAGDEAALELRIELNPAWVNPCDAGQPLACGEVLTVDNTSAPDIYSGTAGDLLYYFNLDSRSEVLLSTCSPNTAIDTRLYVFDTCPYDRAVDYVYYSDDEDCEASSLHSTISARLEAGTWWVIATGYSALEGSMELSLECVANLCPEQQLPFEPQAVSHGADWTFSVAGEDLAALFGDDDSDPLTATDLDLPVAAGFSGVLPFDITVSDGDCNVTETLQLLVHPLPTPESLSAILEEESGVVDLDWTWTNSLESLCEFQNFQVTRNGLTLMTTTGMSLVDSLAAPGLYRYAVSAVYDVGTSLPAPPAAVTWLVLNGPRNLEAALDEPTGAVTLAWQHDNPAEQLLYDNGSSTGAYNYPGYSMATRMSPRSPCQVLGLAYFTVDPQGGSPFTAEIFGFGDGQPETVPTFQATSLALDNDWVAFDLQGENVWVDGEFLAGFSSEENEAYLGCDALLDNGRSWDLEHGGGWAAWNEAYLVRAWVRYTDGEVALLEPGSVEPAGRVPAMHNGRRMSLPAGPVPSQEFGQTDRQLLGFSVFRDGTLLDTTVDTFFVDILMESGSFDYHVIADYAEGPSLPSNTVTVTWELVSVDGALPARFHLDPNVPNPFNPVTRVRFGLPLASSVRAELFTVTGSRVATLLDGALPAGEHDLSVDGTGLASGVYLLHLQAGTQAATLRMTLLK